MFLVYPIKSRNSFAYTSLNFLGKINLYSLLFSPLARLDIKLPEIACAELLALKIIGPDDFQSVVVGDYTII